MSKTFDRGEAYWYARGYHDGRVIGAGVEEGYDAINGFDEHETAACRYAYKQGYDTGVADYVDLDNRTCEACGADIETWDKTVQFEDSVYHEFCCE